MGTEIYFFGGKKDYAEAFHFWAFVSLPHSVQGFGENSRFSYLTFWRLFAIILPYYPLRDKGEAI
jgi:hypothetical protein